MPKHLVVIAHPDDELIYFGREILSQPDVEWHVVCCTDGDNAGRGDARRAEFWKSCAALGVARTFMLGFRDDFDRRLPFAELLLTLRGYVERVGPFDRVYSHNINEWHWHHQDVGLAVGHLFPYVHVPTGGESRLSDIFDDLSRRKSEILVTCYREELGNARDAIKHYWSEHLVRSSLMVLSCLPAVKWAVDAKSVSQLLLIEDVWRYHAADEPRFRHWREEMSIVPFAQAMCFEKEHDIQCEMIHTSHILRREQALDLLVGMWVRQWTEKGLGRHALGMAGPILTIYSQFIDRAELWVATDMRSCHPVGYAISFIDDTTLYDALAPWRLSHARAKPGLLLGMYQLSKAIELRKVYDLGYGLQNYKKQIVERAYDGSYPADERPSRILDDHPSIYRPPGEEGSWPLGGLG